MGEWTMLPASHSFWAGAERSGSGAVGMGLLRGHGEGVGARQMPLGPSVGQKVGAGAPAAPGLIFTVSYLLRSRITRAHSRASTNLVGVWRAPPHPDSHALFGGRTQRNQSIATCSTTCTTDHCSGCSQRLAVLNSSSIWLQGLVPAQYAQRWNLAMAWKETNPQWPKICSFRTG